MDLFGRAELGLLGGGEGLTEDMSVPGLGWSPSGLHDDYPTSGLALAAAYHDIKTRLASLERENSSIKRKLQHYEVKFPVISEFGEEQLLCCSCEPFINDISIIQAKTTNLQQKINSLTQELQKSKEREERLEEVIQAYEKIHLEKSNVQRDLDNMTSLAEQHLERISCLESALKQRDCSLEKLSAQLRSKEWRPGPPPTLDVPREGRGPSLQSSRSLDALSDLKLQRLEVELEGARHQMEGACQREEGLRAELSRLQQELVRLQEIQRQCEHCDVEWIKKAGDEQVNLALAYTELTEELGRVHSLTEKQRDLLQQISQDSVPCSPTAPQHLSPTSPQRPSRSPDRLHPPPSPPLTPSNGPASYTHQPISSRLRAKFRSHRSYSEVTDPSAVQRLPAFLIRDPVSTLPKSRPILGGGAGSYSKSKLQVRASLVGPVRPASAHGLASDRGGAGGGAGGGGSLSCSPLQRTVHHFRQLDDTPEPTPLVTPPQSSEDEEDECQYVLPTASPPRTLGAIGISSSPPREPSFPAPRKQAQHPSLSAPEAAAPLSRHLPPYTHSEHAQSWPSINLWMESEESAARSCPLCQLTFPTGYPDDALIKHIDSHLENSKI